MVINNHKARWIVNEIPNRPTDWPRKNLREFKVSLVWECVQKYYEDPNPMARDIMIGHAFDYRLEDLPSTVIIE